MLKRAGKAIVIVVLTTVGLALTIASLSANESIAEACVAPSGVGGCFATIQEALDTVDAGGTVRVLAGTYIENIEIEKAVSLLGGFDDTTFNTRTPRSSIIDANGMDRVISIRNTAPVIIDGFTVTGGSTEGEGGGIGVSNARVTITDNLIEENVAGTDAEEYGQGGGIYANGDTTIVTLTQSTIRGNIASLAGKSGSGGGMIFDEIAAAIVTSNTIAANTAVISGSSGSGGGMVFASVRELTLTDNVISENVALRNGVSTDSPQHVSAKGGGVDIGGGDIDDEIFTIRNNQIVSNTAAQIVTVTGADAFVNILGGGLVIRDVSTLHMDDNAISGNRAAGSISMTGTGGWGGTASGGGAFISNGVSILISGNDFTANVTAEEQHVIDTDSGSEGGAMTIIDVESASLTGNEFTGNAGVADGSVTATIGVNYYVSGGGLFFNCWSKPTCTVALEENLLSGNMAARTFTVNSENANGGGYGGALSIIKQSVTLRGNVLLDNIGREMGSGGGDGGGAININESQLTMTGNRVIGNYGNQTGGGTGGIQMDRTTLTSTNDVFADNDSAIGAWNNNEIMLVNDTFNNNGPVAASVANNSNLRAYNSIITNHEVGLQSKDDMSSVTGDYNLMYNETNYAGGASGGPEDILGQAPEFVDTAGGDYHLASDSPAIDAGDNTIAPANDFDGDMRPRDGNLDGDARADIGADEFMPTSIHLPVIFSE